MALRFLQGLIYFEGIRNDIRCIGLLSSDEKEPLLDARIIARFPRNFANVRIHGFYIEGTCRVAIYSWGATETANYCLGANPFLVVFLGIVICRICRIS